MTVSEVFEPVRTERLVLRGYRADDVDDLLRFYSRREVCRFLFDDPWTIEHAQKVVQRKVSCRSLSDGYLALVVEYDGRVVGNVGAWLIEGAEHSAELGWVFSPEVAGRGLATEAVTALLDLVFAAQSLHRVRAQMDARTMLLRGSHVVWECGGRPISGRMCGSRASGRTRWCSLCLLASGRRNLAEE